MPDRVTPVQVMLSITVGMEMLRINWIILASSLCLSIVFSANAADLDLTVVYDNNPYDKRLETRWGFSCLVEGPEKTIIFDVGGEGSILLRNMERLAIDPKAIGLVVLSHIHGDHIGGLPTFLKRNPNVTVYMPRSFPMRVKEGVLGIGARLVEIRGPTEICKDVYSTGELGDWLKEESLVVKTSKGLVVITGCAHPGIVRIVKEAKGMLQAEVFLALGGFHLGGMSFERIEEIVNRIKDEGVKNVAPCHCSGDLARKVCKEVFGEGFVLTGVGKRITIEDAFK
jgi:7,8-dihydropterin-6-yl-methyl-4-(beta-D-ribofuranosyl)aminobenzene 5'-phosphate synthase